MPSMITVTPPLTAAVSSVLPAVCVGGGVVVTAAAELGGVGGKSPADADPRSFPRSTIATTTAIAATNATNIAAVQLAPRLRLSSRSIPPSVARLHRAPS